MSQAAVVDRRRWYALQTKPKQEDRADSNLRRWEIETLSPKLREWRFSRAGAGAFRVAPLFPNYLFARFDAEERGAKVRLTRGIQRIVGLGEYATPIDDTIVELIRSRVADDGLVHPVEAEPGDLVEIVDGPLRSLVGVFERRLSARDRVVILLSAIGGPARVQVATAAMRKATPPVA